MTSPAFEQTLPRFSARLPQNATSYTALSGTDANLIGIARGLSARMRFMRFQFSLATLLVCMTVLAVVCAVSVTLPVQQKVRDWVDPPRYSAVGKMSQERHTVYRWRSPSIENITWRVIVWGPLAFAATLAMLWTIRCLKSRRHIEPPVG
jgi:hypothetical protein